jgi:hypothetical protein
MEVVYENKHKRSFEISTAYEQSRMIAEYSLIVSLSATL